VAADEGSLAWLVMQLSKELGELSGSIAAALSDGRVTDAEAGDAEGQLHDLMRVGHQLAGTLAQIREGGRHAD